ncbi:uncharacterized protein LOC128770136 [Synchiropus splendidus]|uniref:uncharacterized protein LOC128770136 n=1 Tax=Synchiropus splendidus TaxID=270530 RepID=UPI00237D482B|nr:uncharacterized protein LOC128770136 [Synchiropus splendidus]
MYPEGAQPTGHHRFLHHNSNTYCPCQRCVHHELPYSLQRGLGHQPASTRLTAHRANYGPQADRVQRSGHHSPQRRPVFVGPGPSGQSDDFSQVCPRELNPAPWIYPQECGVRHYPSVREQCGCVMRRDTRAIPFNAGMPHPLPHLQVKGEEHRKRRAVRYAPANKDEEDAAQRRYSEPPASHVDHSLKPNGHCGPRTVFFEGGEERDIHQDWDRQKGGSEEVCNGHCDSPKGFFATEVPQKHLNQRKSKGTTVGGVVDAEPSKVTQLSASKHHTGLEVVKKKRPDSVRDQIRQVVMDLEDVLGGLKQVHVEMKQVVEQIDRLTANIDLSEETPTINQSASNNASTRPADPKAASPPNHRSAPAQGAAHPNEDRIILRTNAPSPIHMASVVKTSCFIPPTHRKEGNQERPGANGHPPHLYSNHIGQPESQTLTADSTEITGNGNVGSKTQKPPPYPQNGRCAKGSHKALRTPTHSGRGRHTTSIV